MADVNMPRESEKKISEETEEERQRKIKVALDVVCDRMGWEWKTEKAKPVIVRVWHRYLTATHDRLVYRAGGWSDVLIIDTEAHNIQIDTNTVTDRTALEFLPAVFEELGKTEIWSLNGYRAQSSKPIPQTKESSSPEEVAARTERLVRARKKAIPTFIGTGTPIVSAHRNESKATEAKQAAGKQDTHPGPPPMPAESEASRVANERRKKRGMNDDTREKLKLLSSIREQNIKNDNVDIAWTIACQRAKIDPDTARRYAKELRAKWDDPTYHNRTEFAE